MESKEIAKVVNRRHPLYTAMVNHWDFLELSYEGGRKWFDAENIHKYHKEGTTEYKARVERAYRFNHTREVVELVNKYLFRAPIGRSDDAPTFLKEFWESATLKGLDMDEFMEEVARKSSTFGCPWIIIDNNGKGLGENASEKDQEDSGTELYAYVVRPQDVLDMSYDDQGVLNWILIRENYRDDADWQNTDGKVKQRYRLWTRDSWKLFEKKGRTWEKTDGDDTGLGLVPAVRADHVLTADDYSSPALIADIAYLDRAVANYASNMDAIIQDQTFSQLAMPAQGLLPGEDVTKKLIEAGTKRIFTFDGEAGARPEYLSPDPRQAALITSVIKQLIGEIYHSVGMAGERTKQDNNQGIDNSSGVAKKQDADRVMALLRSKATSLETIENRIAEVVAAWHSEDLDKDLVAYSETFDVRSLEDELAMTSTVMMLSPPDKVLEQQMNILIEKMFPDLSEQLLEEMKAEVGEWLKERRETATLSTTPDSKSSSLLEESRRDRESAADQQSDTAASRD